MSAVAQGLEATRERVRRAALAAGRDPAEVRLLAVSKTQPASAVREAYAAGQRDFGENYLQELAAKARELGDLPELRWHSIGHVQRNKARLLVEHASVVHTIHSVELGRELDRRAEAVRLSTSRRFYADEPRILALVEVNLRSEAQKSGVRPNELGALLDAVEASAHLRLCGLMCVPPLSVEPAPARVYFEELAELRERHGGRIRLPELSMGMSADLEVAIEAGASIVRVGTAIFGERRKDG